MKKLYDKSEIVFALVWIGLYVVVMNIALQVCGGFDDLKSKTAGQLLVPVVCICVLAIAATAWILKNGLAEKFGLIRFKGNPKALLWFIPLIIMSCINLKNGLALNAPAVIALLMAVNMAMAGYVEEVIFRGFLFRAMAKDNLKSAVIVSAVTFGVGHIVNLANTADTLGVILQVCYAIVIGFLYTVIVYKGGSLWPCVASHMFVNGSSVFAKEQGPFTDLVNSLFANSTLPAEDISSAVLIILISGGYALWLWKKGEVSV
ncbi:MAG: CPBP family intramembrane metalloprotease [Oscillospiraceae bacterium]|nr:CPBP family intramembrane metalloprotease [Oscillospiraceae bacterium]